MHFVLVHGAWHGATCWEELEKELVSGGNTVHCVEFPGSGSYSKVPVDSVTYANYKAVVEKAVKQSLFPCTLIVHSMSGMVGGPISDELTDKIAHVFFISAYIPINGESMAEQAEKYRNPASLSAFKLREDKLALSVIPEKAQEFFYNCCPQNVCREVVKRTNDQVREPMREKVWWKPREDLSHKRTYIACGKDLMIPLKSQLAIAKRITDRIFIIPEADHFPQFSRVKDLVKKITTPIPDIRSKL